MWLFPSTMFLILISFLVFKLCISFQIYIKIYFLGIAQPRWKVINSKQTTERLCCPLNCLPGKTWACIMSSRACYPLLPSASAYNAPLPSAPPVEQFYCFHKFCMIHISSSLSPLHSDTPSFSAPPHLLSLAVSESRWMSDTQKRFTFQRHLLGLGDVLSLIYMVSSFLTGSAQVSTCFLCDTKKFFSVL